MGAGRTMKGCAMGAALTAMGGRMGAVLPGVPCHCASAAIGTSVMSPTVRNPRIPTTLPIQDTPKLRGRSNLLGPTATLICKADITFCRESMVET